MREELRNTFINAMAEEENGSPLKDYMDQDEVLEVLCYALEKVMEEENERV